MSQYYETTCMVCQRPQTASYPYVICKECSETSRAVDYVHGLQVKLAAYERLERAARDVESADQEKMPNIGMAHALHRLYAALRECEEEK